MPILETIKMWLLLLLLLFETGTAVFDAVKNTMKGYYLPVETT